MLQQEHCFGTICLSQTNASFSTEQKAFVETFSTFPNNDQKICHISQNHKVLARRNTVADYCSQHIS